MCRDIHYKDKTIVRPYHLYNGNSEIVNTAPLCADSSYNCLRVDHMLSEYIYIYCLWVIVLSLRNAWRIHMKNTHKWALSRCQDILRVAIGHFESYYRNSDSLVAKRHFNYLWPVLFLSMAWHHYATRVSAGEVMTSFGCCVYKEPTLEK